MDPAESLVNIVKPSSLKSPGRKLAVAVFSIVLALMATSLIASGTSKLVCKKPVYVALAENFMKARLLEGESKAGK